MSKPRNPLIPYVLNSDYEDEVLMVWDTLTKNSESLLSSDIIMETGIQATKVFQVLNAMTNTSVVLKEDVKGERYKTYKLAVSIDAISWAMALELGIPPHSLAKHVQLSETDLEIFHDSDKDVSYFVNIVKEKNKLEKEKKKKELIEDKTQNLIASSEVSKILDDLDFLFHTLPANDPMANYVVETRKAFIQAQKTLNKHLESKYSIKNECHG